MLCRWRWWERHVVALLVGLLIVEVMMISSACLTQPKGLNPGPEITESLWRRSGVATGECAEFNILLWIAGVCSLIAVGCVLASIVFPLPVLRKLAGGALGCAVASWVLFYLLCKYLWLAVGLAVLVFLVFAFAFAWGHRKWFERKTGVDITPDDLPPGVEKPG